MAPERAAAGFVSPDMQVDRLVAHDSHAFDVQAADDLRRTEVLTQHPFDRREVRRPVAAIAMRAGTSAIGLLHREFCAVEAVMDTAVASDLAIDGTTMSAQAVAILAIGCRCARMAAIVYLSSVLS